MRTILAATICLLAAACGSPDRTGSLATGTHLGGIDTLESPPKNIILMIGDGMGLTQITAALYSNGDRLYLEEFPVTGLHKPYASDNLVTDSAAGATAFAAGVKTYNGAVGVNTDTLPVQSILEEAQKRGWATGIITTSSVVHATPASFVAHVKSRDMYEDIAEAFLPAGIDLVIGGGKRFFDRRSKDDQDLYQALETKGYQVSDYFKANFKDFQPDPLRPFFFFTADGEPMPYSQGRDYLVPASAMAPRFLAQRSDKGFFLLIEGAQIDWGGHANNSDYIISETLEFDRAVGKALEFARQNKETLVIVTADHEAGGYAINLGSTRDSLITSFTTDGHTAALIPVFAFGPRASLFHGVYENTDIHRKMRQALGF